MKNMAPSIASFSSEAPMGDGNIRGEHASKRRKLGNLSSPFPSLREGLQNQDSSPNDFETAETYPTECQSTLVESELSRGLPFHPLGVKPLGNVYDASSPNIKVGAGSFVKLPDELLLQLLEYCAAFELLKLGATCKALYAFCSYDELWKALFVE